MALSRILLVDDAATWRRLHPLTCLSPIADVRIGILTIGEKWAERTGASIDVRSDASLHLAAVSDDDVDRVVASDVLPDDGLVRAIAELGPDDRLVDADGRWVAGRGDREHTVEGAVRRIDRPWDVFRLNDAELRRDFELVTAGRHSAPLSDTNTLIGPRDNLFIERGAWVEASTLNVEDAPIYIGRGAKILEGCSVRLGLALCEHAVLKMGARIYGATTVGPHCKVGGEVSNSVLFGYSNKGHDGYLGNAVIGRWCNLGADTTNSNLKNNYGMVTAWSMADEAFIETGLQFLGLIMGDHAKSGINTMFNTATVVGPFANIFGAEFPPKYVPPFRWGRDGVFRLDKAFEMAERMMARRGLELTERERDTITALHRAHNTQT